MKQFRVSIEETRKGNFRLRLHYPDGRRVASGHCIEKHEQALVNGKMLTGKSLANALAEKLYDEQRQKQLGYVNPHEPWGALVESYLKELRVNNMAENTIRNAHQALSYYTKDKGIKTVADSNTKALESWKMMITDEEMAASTIRLHLRKIHEFHKWLIEKKFANTDPFVKGMMPQTKDKDPQFYTAAEFQALDAAMATLSHPGRVAINLAHECGLRRAEIVGNKQGQGGVCWEDIAWFDEEAPDLMVRRAVAKGGVPGKVTLTEGVLALLGSRKTGRLVSLDYGRLYKVFVKARRKAGIKATLDIHGLRDTFAKNFLQRTGESLAALKEAMRHKSIMSTMIYAQFERSHLKKAIARSYEGRLREEALIQREVI